MDTAFFFLVVIVVLALAFDFINGFHDAANAIATVVSTRVLSPRTAVLYGAVLNFLGAFYNTEVAATVGKGIVEQRFVTLETIFCALLGAIIWNLITWYKGLPSSSSHALIGALVGAACFSNLFFQGNVVDWGAITHKVLIPMITSPLLGFAIGFLLMLALTWLVHRMSVHRINKVFSPLQIVSAGWMAYSHGNNDAQKSMGIIALAIAICFPSHGFHVDKWVIIACATAMGIGTLSGGWKIIRTIGSKMIKLQPVHGFAAEATATTIILAASHQGIPLSTTHVISSAIMGVGTTKRLSAVKWGVVGNILWAWVLTFPISFLLSGTVMVLYRLVEKLF
jgi:inorganic phosphate transporter, PiT family